jgi:uncharacterized protein
MKKNLLWIAASVILIFSLTACAGATTQTPPANYLSVTGVGRTYLNPDIAYISIGVQTQSEDVASALDQNSAQAQAVADALTAQGVAAEDIQTTAFNITPQQQYSPEGQVIGTIYIVQNSVNVTVRDLQNMGKLLEAVVTAGANSINSISYDVSDKSAAVSEARRLAVEDAKAQAQELADLAGVGLGKVTGVSVYVNTPMPVTDGKYYGIGGASQVPVSAGQLVIEATSSMSYEIVSK